MPSPKIMYYCRVVIYPKGLPTPDARIRYRTPGYPWWIHQTREALKVLHDPVFTFLSLRILFDHPTPVRAMARKW